ncbi:hypothetical protein C8R43DRAFT_965510 [Mycena crocata]|nr:hypothetical protein C8R43DRAFT_965510 [Mycena crocata]
MKLTTVFGNPSREKALVAIVKRICSSVRNSLRQDFKRGGAGSNLDVGFTVHNALLCRFARENPVAIGILEVKDEESAEDYSSSPAPGNSKKRKVSPTNHGGGRIVKRKDFWSQVDAFFSQKITEYGSKNLQSSGWKAYMAETLAEAEAIFPDSNGAEKPMTDLPPQAGPSVQAVAHAASWGLEWLLGHRCCLGSCNGQV